MKCARPQPLEGLPVLLLLFVISYVGRLK